MSDERKIFPVTKEVMVQGKAVVVSVVKVKQLTSVVAAIQPFMSYLPKPGDVPDKTPINFFDLVTSHTDDVVYLLTILTGESKETLGEADVGELVDLCVAAFEVNLDFFIQRVLPSASMGMGRLVSAFYAGQMPTSGPSPSSA